MSCTHPKIYKGRLLPCGKCVSCRKKRINDWVVRLDLERKLYRDNCCFVTLTYNNENLPEDGFLNRRDLQLFMKRLRRRFEGTTIRSFGSGEYGSELRTFRPHYHLILYGVSWRDTSIIKDCWKLGFSDIAPVEMKNCRYVAKYCCKETQKEKKVFKIDSITGHVKEFVVSEFITMSRRGGLGFSIIGDNDIFKKYCRDNYIKVGNYHYSIPYAFKRKAKELGYNYFESKKINVLYNDVVFKNKDEFIDSDSFYNLFIGCKVDWSIKNLNINDFEFISFKDYFKDFFENIEKEKNFCKIRKIDFIQYYQEKFKRFCPFGSNFKNITEKMQGLFISFSKNSYNLEDLYFSWFKNNIYSHFDCLFY